MGEVIVNSLLSLDSVYELIHVNDPFNEDET
nr:MAG TPA: hypothetical protein [Caudoviricetes sp.]